MKIQTGLRSPFRHRRTGERGMAVIVVIAIVAILLIYIGGNLRTLHLLSRDLKLVEQRQIRRLSNPNPATNAPPPVRPVSWPARQNWKPPFAEGSGNL